MFRNERLRQQRILRNWRQQDLADELGITTITIQRWERGSQHPSSYYRVKLCALFGRSSQELGLLEGEDELQAGGEIQSERQWEGGIAPERGLWMISQARNLHFTGRDTLLKQVMQSFFPLEQDQSKNIFRQTGKIGMRALKGLGGVGKTQIAVEYAYRAHEQGRYKHTLWIDAGSEKRILSSFEALIEQVPALRSSYEMEQGKRVAMGISWLEECEQPWLLIADNVDELELIQPYLPTRGAGHILLTTRASAVGAFAASIEVESMGVIEGSEFLLRRVQRFASASDEEMNEVANLVVTLGQFPLALDQAGAYIEETGCSIREYQQIYEGSRSILLSRRGRQLTGYPDSVVTTWAHSFKRIEQENGAAAEFLRLCAFLAPDHIPEELLIGGGPYWPVALQEVVKDRLRFNQMLKVLLAFSLVRRVPDERVFTIHRLVQAVQMGYISVQEQRVWAERVVLALHAVFSPPQKGSSWPQCVRFLEQVSACAVLIQRYQIQLPEAADLLNRAGLALREQGFFDLAAHLSQRDQGIREEREGGEASCGFRLTFANVIYP